MVRIFENFCVIFHFVFKIHTIIFPIWHTCTLIDFTTSKKKSEYIFIWLALIFNLCLLSYLFTSITSWKREKKISCCLRKKFYSLYTDILSRKTRSLPLRSSSSRQRDNAVCKGDVPLGFRFSGRNKNFHLLDYIYCRRKK